MTVYDFRVKTIEGREVKLDEYKDKVLLIVNVASKCGFTPQYEGLEIIFEKHKDQGFAVLAFPCNQFGAQEPGTEEDIKSFCDLQYGVKFPLFSKIDVNGPNTHPLYEFLKKSLPGVLGSEGIKWNFTKFLIDRQGNPVKRYGSADKPESINQEIEALL